MSTATDPPTGLSVESGARRRDAATVGEDRLQGLRMRTRLFLGAAGLLAFTLALATAFVSDKARRVAEAKILKDLGTVPAIYEGYRDSQASARQRQVRSFAEEAGTKALFA